MVHSIADFVSRLAGLDSSLGPTACPVCRFREVAGWPEATGANIPIDVLENGFCRACRGFLSANNGEIIDGVLIFKLRDEAAG